MFAVTGITGKVGGAVARTLLAAGLSVRALVRDVAKGAPWAAQGCELAVADLDKTGRLADAFAGVDGAFAMLPPTFDPSPGFPEAEARIATLRAALAEARPPKLVVLSTVGADATRPNLLNQLGLLERALADLPTRITFLRPGWFMENAAADVASASEAGVIRSYLQPLDHAVPMVAADDVGRTAAALLQEDWAGHRIVELQTERVTPNAIASAFGKAFGRPVRAEALPRACWEEIFRSEGMRNPLPRMQMIDGFNEGWVDFPNRGTGARKGRIDLDSAIAALVSKATNR
ncbi:MAG TPA: NmrA family NAD(P)-binding protein [Bradyrhizobium sp.]|nr:NmrA family NAD(P)-binding protein [Bradyrhizobium sp.]